MITLSDKLYQQLEKISDEDLSKSVIIAIALKEYFLMREYNQIKRISDREKETTKESEENPGIYII